MPTPTNLTARNPPMGVPQVGSPLGIMPGTSRDGGAPTARPIGAPGQMQMPPGSARPPGPGGQLGGPGGPGSPMMSTRSSAPGTARLTARKGGGQPHIMKYTGWLQWFQSFFVTLFDIPDEELEEYRMLSGLDPLEICRLRAYFEDEVGDDKGVMTKEHFLSIPFIADNPLKDRLALCFGYDDDTPEMDFVQWIQGVALFNSHGKREEKLRIAFKMQDIDADGMISKDDLTQYMHLVTGLPTDSPDADKPEEFKVTHLTLAQTDFNAMELKDIVDEVFRESSSDNKMQYLTFQDFSRVLAPTDFHIKLLLPF